MLQSVWERCIDYFIFEAILIMGYPKIMSHFCILRIPDLLPNRLHSFCCCELSVNC